MRAANRGTLRAAARAVASTDAPIGTDPSLSELTLSAPDGTPLATPSALTAGEAFSVTSSSPATSSGPGTFDGPGNSNSPGTSGSGEWYQG